MCDRVPGRKCSLAAHCNQSTVRSVCFCSGAQSLGVVLCARHRQRAKFNSILARFGLSLDRVGISDFLTAAHRPENVDPAASGTGACDGIRKSWEIGAFIGPEWLPPTRHDDNSGAECNDSRGAGPAECGTAAPKISTRYAVNALRSLCFACVRANAPSLVRFSLRLHSNRLLARSLARPPAFSAALHSAKGSVCNEVCWFGCSISPCTW